MAQFCVEIPDDKVEQVLNAVGAQYRYQATVVNPDFDDQLPVDPDTNPETITNPENDKYVIAKVKSNKVKFSNFYNSILTPRIAEELDLELKEPYVEITLISKDSMFVAKKAKMFDEEKSVAEKAPVDGIQINDLNVIKTKKKEVLNKEFSYSIKVADFYFKDTAQNMSKRIKNELSINNINILKISKTKFRVLIGPFNDIKTLKDSFEKMNSLNFENLEILRNV